MKLLLKKFGLLLTEACLSIMILVSAAQAATLDPIYASDDLTVKTSTSMPFDSSYDYVTNVGGKTKMVSYLKFDLSSLKNKTIESIKLSMYGSINPFGDVQENNIGIFYAGNISWTEENPSILSYDTEAISSTSHPTSTPFVNTFYTWDIFPLTTVTSSMVNDQINKGWLSLVVQEMGTYEPGELAETIFRSRTDTTAAYKPQLKVEYTAPGGGGTPAPEPSSMLLGMLSLGGFFGLKKRKK